MHTMPDWINWIAQDRGGAWYGFNYRPKPDHSTGFWESTGGTLMLLDIQEPNPDWQRSLCLVGWLDDKRHTLLRCNDDEQG